MSREFSMLNFYPNEVVQLCSVAVEPLPEEFPLPSRDSQGRPLLLMIAYGHPATAADHQNTVRGITLMSISEAAGVVGEITAAVERAGMAAALQARVDQIVHEVREQYEADQT